MKKIIWFARGGGIAKCGPFDTQIEATDAVRLEPGNRDVFPSDAFVWPEFEDHAQPKKAAKQPMIEEPIRTEIVHKEQGGRGVAAMITTDFAYEGVIDTECLPLCEAMNALGLRTISSCCGHGDEPFRIWFCLRDPVKDLTGYGALSVLLYNVDPCYVGFQWHVRVTTDCGCSAPKFCLESDSCGQEAFNKARQITQAITKELQRSKGLGGQK